MTLTSGFLDVFAFLPAATIGFFLPGYVISVLLNSTARFCSGFLISTLVLFYTVIGLDVAGLPIRFGYVLMCEMAIVIVALGAFPFCRRSVLGLFTIERHLLAADQYQLILISSVLIIGTILLARCIIQPLSGYDTVFRWDFLAVQLLRLERLDFYPPVTQADFHYYSFVDSIPPIVSISYWWLYAAIGERRPELTSFFIMFQFICIMAFVYKLARRLYGTQAGAMACAVLASTPLFVKSVAIGQETGMTALSIIAMIYFLSSVEQKSHSASMILAGLSASVGVLSREYGWVFIPCGWLVLLWLRRSRKDLFLFSICTVAISFPWYLRTWIMTGNPLFSLPLTGFFPVNAVHVLMMETHNHYHTLWNNTSSEWLSLLGYFFLFAILPPLFGLPGCLLELRRYGYYLISSICILGLWMQSVGYTAGGVIYSARVLNPALVLLSVPAGGFLSRITRSPRMKAGALGVLLLALGWCIVNTVLLPFNPLRLPSREWAFIATKRVEFQYAEPRLPEELRHILGSGGRILTESTYVHAALSKTEFDPVLVWSPEVKFLFDQSVKPIDVRRMLLSHGIRYVLFNPSSVFKEFLQLSPFYRDDRRYWRKMGRTGIVAVLYALPDA